VGRKFTHPITTTLSTDVNTEFDFSTVDYCLLCASHVTRFGDYYYYIYFGTYLLSSSAYGLVVSVLARHLIGPRFDPRPKFDGN